jgi:proteasome lid subunit RPN8/RPN11
MPSKIKPDKRECVGVTISRRLVDQIKREAKRLFPVECYGIMLGTRASSSITIEQIIWPDVSGTHATEDFVMVKPEWQQHAEGVARDSGLQVIGDVHSHCYEQPVTDHAPSQDDWDRLDRTYIQAIVVVTPCGKPGSLRASVKIWDCPRSVTMKMKS